MTFFCFIIIIPVVILQIGSTLSTPGFILASAHFLGSWAPGQAQLSWLISAFKTDIFNHCGLEPSRNCVTPFTEMDYADLAGSRSMGLYVCVGMVSEPK